MSGSLNTEEIELESARWDCFVSDHLKYGATQTTVEEIAIGLIPKLVATIRELRGGRLNARLESYVSVLKHSANTIHQAYHSDSDVGWYECHRRVLQSMRHELRVLDEVGSTDPNVET